APAVPERDCCQTPRPAAARRWQSRIRPTPPSRGWCGRDQKLLGEYEARTWPQFNGPIRFVAMGLTGASLGSVLERRGQRPDRCFGEAQDSLQPGRHIVVEQEFGIVEMRHRRN